MAGRSGAESHTADSVVGTSGRPIRLYAVNMLSGATAGQLVLRNGISDTAAILVREVGVIDTGKTVEYGVEGMLFPNGLFYDDDSNFTGVTFQFSEEL